MRTVFSPTRYFKPFLFALCLLSILKTPFASAQTLSWSWEPDLIQQRSQLGAAVIDGKIYAIGGYCSYTRSECEVYDVVSGSSWESVSSLPISRQAGGVTAVNGKIYAIGGYSDANLKAVDWMDDVPGFWEAKMDQVAAVHIYDPTTDTWYEGARMITPRMFFATAVLDGKIYAIGGSAVQTVSTGEKKTTVMNTVEYYDPASNGWFTGPSLPEARTNAAATSINGKIYLSGGIFSGVGPWDEEDDFLVYNGGGWSNLADLPTGRQGHCMVAVDDKVYALGGIDYNAEEVDALNTVDVYDVSAGTWSGATNMSYARHKFSAVVVNDSIFAVGGSNSYHYENAEASQMYRVESTMIRTSGSSCTVSLESGWNLFTICGSPNDNSVEAVLSEIEGKYNVIWGFDDTGTTWQMYDPDMPEMSDLTTIEMGKGYWIDMITAAELTIDGNGATTGASLIDGWNLIGYVGETRSIDEALESVSGKYESLWSYQDGRWKTYYSSSPASGSLTELDSGLAYWILGTENATWTLPVD